MNDTITDAVRDLIAERDALSNQKAVLLAEYVDALRRETGAVESIEQYRAERDALKAENERYKAALDKIADNPPGHWRYDCKDFADCIDIARAALEATK